MYVFLEVVIPCKLLKYVSISFLHRVHMASVAILHLLRLVGDGSVLYVEGRKKEVGLAGIAIKEAQQKSC